MTVRNVAIRPELREAMRLHRIGAHKRAERLYREVLRKDPKDSVALHFLGLLQVTLNREHDEIGRAHV